MGDVTQRQQELLDAEAKRRVRVALRQIEEAQNLLGQACSTLSSLCYAHSQQLATSKLYDRVHAHWYKVQGALEFNNKVCLDSLNKDSFLRECAKGGAAHG